MKLSHLLTLSCVALVLHGLRASAQQCGRQAGGALCADRLCCSQHGWCGNTPEYCGTGCQSQCGGSTGTGGVGSIITRDLFDRMLKYRNDGRCPSNGFYTYDAFIAAARSFNGFGTTGDLATRKRELAAFLGQTSHETTAWPCPPGRQYYGRGPMQLTHNYNYGQAGRAIGEDLINNPDLVATNPTISFKTAIWFWMTPQGNKPSCHDVIIGQWRPSVPDNAAGRVPGYGVITNIINGGLECGRGPDSRVQDRIGFYRRYCDMLGVGYGNNLDCSNQRPFA
ncbi:PATHOGENESIS-RELATED 3, basic chitinase [Hibiscus trionum]|uniref:chitinase n=1 Tax=Hibiscus trionum TaxID=183268 RepID=A0A9W7LUD6_HIBTR|nr:PATHOGENESIS-RELATED 3, basic chitinase [Hibiscus trionum]